ncbi:hypothetical protein AVEN_202345-1, partial [Araneus ventricosus]
MRLSELIFMPKYRPVKTGVMKVEQIYLSNKSSTLSYSRSNH